MSLLQVTATMLSVTFWRANSVICYLENLLTVSSAACLLQKLSLPQKIMLKTAIDAHFIILAPAVERATWIAVPQIRAARRRNEWVIGAGRAELTATPWNNTIARNANKYSLHSPRQATLSTRRALSCSGQHENKILGTGSIFNAVRTTNRLCIKRKRKYRFESAYCTSCQLQTIAKHLAPMLLGKQAHRFSLFLFEIVSLHEALFS